MTRRDNAHARCERCRVHRSLCFCAELPTLPSRTRLVLFLHRYEARKTTNTGSLAASCLPNSVVVIRGHEHAPTPPYVEEPDRRTLLLFPHEDATPIDRLPPDDRPVTLLVPDGTWRQASKVRQRVPGLASLQCVSLPLGPPARHRLRAEAHETGMATLEAIARAFGALGEPEVRTALERVLRMLVERSLWARGTIDAADVTDGLPATAVRHDPWSGVDRERS
jgi:DTW domain-containing protein YfiP